MSQPTFFANSKLKIGLIIALFMVFSSCAKDVYNPHFGNAENIAVFSGGYLLEMSKASDLASIFALSGNPAMPQGHGKKVIFNIGSDDFETLEYDLRLLEIRAFKEDEIVDRLVGEDTMGFDCSHRITDNESLFVEWRYQDGVERYALYYLGCHNSISENLRSSYFGHFDRLLSSVAQKKWSVAMLKDDGSVE